MRGIATLDLNWSHEENSSLNEKLGEYQERLNEPHYQPKRNKKERDNARYRTKQISKGSVVVKVYVLLCARFEDSETLNKIGS